MALYRVQGNGKAPAGLQVGDEVVTGGGTYRILGVNAVQLPQFAQQQVSDNL